MPHFDPNWTLTWTAVASGVAIANGSFAESAEISNNQKLATEVVVEVAYGASVQQGVIVYVERETSAGWEGPDDVPWGFELAYEANNTRKRVFSIPASEIPKFKIRVVNNTGSSVTYSIHYRQATLDQLA